MGVGGVAFAFLGFWVGLEGEVAERGVGATDGAGNEDAGRGGVAGGNAFAGMGVRGVAVFASFSGREFGFR